MFRLPMFRTNLGEDRLAEGRVLLDGDGQVLAPGLREVAALATNVNAQIAAAAAVPVTVYGGTYLLSAAATNWNGSSALLQYLLPDAITWVTISTRTANDVSAPAAVDLPSNAVVRLLVSAANPTGLYVTLSRRPYAMSFPVKAGQPWVDLPVISIRGPIAVPEGNGAGVRARYHLVRGGGEDQAVTVSYAVTGSGLAPATAADFGGAFPSGTVSFGAGDRQKVLDLTVTGNAAVDGNRAFAVTLSNPTLGTLGTASAVTTIIDDDVADGLLTPPAGYVFVTDADGTYLTDPDGAYLMEAI